MILKSPPLVLLSGKILTAVLTKCRTLNPTTFKIAQFEIQTVPLPRTDSLSFLEPLSEEEKVISPLPWKGPSNQVGCADGTPNQSTFRRMKRLLDW
jgi:hypothetical protein